MAEGRRRVGVGEGDKEDDGSVCTHVGFAILWNIQISSRKLYTQSQNSTEGTGLNMQWILGIHGSYGL